MWLVLPFVFSLLLSNVASVKDIPTLICTSEINRIVYEKHQLNSSGLYLTLYHPHSPCSPAPLPNLPFSTIFAHDNSRVASLEAHLSKKSSTRLGSSKLKEDQAQVPLSPGTSVQVGNYVTRVGLGTPASSYIMIVDTGSSFCWLQCKPCIRQCHTQADPIFNPESSSTYYQIPCTASECSNKSLESATLNPSLCSSKSNACIYQATYGDGSFSYGYLSRDTLSFAGSSFPNFIFGCGQDNEGLFGSSDGLIGLARNKLSLLYQLAPSLGSSTFSYCLPSTSSSGYLSIGAISSSGYYYTPLLNNPLADFLYFLKLSSISVSAQPIGVSSSSYTSLPTIIDSGTVISRLPSDVYTALSKAVVAAMAGTPRASAYSILDTCFSGSASNLKVPVVSLTFLGGSTIKLQATNVLIDVTSSTTCLAFASANKVAILGNTQQQSFSVLYDVGNSRLGFAAGGCQ